MLSVTPFHRTACVLLTTLLVAAPALAAPQQEELEQGVAQLQNQEFEAALATFDGIIEDNEAIWQAHFYRGMALGSMERFDEAQQAFLRSVELNPGFANGHQMAAMASRDLQDWETAWDQAIQAHVAGVDMTQFFDQLRQVSEEPADLEERLNVTRVFVANPDVSDAEANEQLREAVQQAQAELITVTQELGKLIAEAGPFTLVRQPDAAQYVAVFKVRDVSVDDDDRQVDGIEGEVNLFAPGTDEPAWNRRIEFNNMRLPTIVSELRRLVDFMVEWTEEGGGGA